MKWHEGNIGSAIQDAKKANALFVVVVHGPSDDATSAKLMDVLDSPEVSAAADSAVAIRLENGGTACAQFAQLYPIVLVPSVYLINSATGVDLDVTGGDVTAEQMVARIEKAKAEVKKSSAESKAKQEESSTASSSEAAAGTSASSSQSSSIEERVARAKQLLAERQAQKQSQEEDKEKTSEMDRRDLGRQMQELKRRQDEQATREAADERRRDREETKLARERVRAQIEQDRADRAAKFNSQKAEAERAKAEKEQKRLEEEQRAADELAAIRSTVARVQFRLPDGRSQTTQFDAAEPLSVLYAYVREQVPHAFGRNFSLSTTFPSRLLDREDRDRTSLREAGLAPSATVLVLPSASTAVSSASDGGFMGLVWLMLTPLVLVWNFLSALVSSFGHSPNPNTRAEGPPAAAAAGGATPQNARARAAARSTTGIRKDGNLARLRHDASDDDDDNNTWNGNSTQQM